MGRTSPGTVKETGAKPKQILVGSKDLNRGLRIKVYRRQEPKGGRIVGHFDIESTGNGIYASYINKLNDKCFDNAKEFIDKIRALGGEKCTHILNRRKLKIEKKLH